MCETPKSPPGDYNVVLYSGSWNPGFSSVKHLNPRQGITTFVLSGALTAQHKRCVKHLNPRQGITTLPGALPGQHKPLVFGVKHLNPRQGITTRRRYLPRTGGCGTEV